MHYVRIFELSFSLTWMQQIGFAELRYFKVYYFFDKFEIMRNISAICKMMHVAFYVGRSFWRITMVLV